MREPLHSPAIQGQRREHGPSHKRVFLPNLLRKTFQYFCDASKVLTMKFDAATPSLSLHASFWRFITHEGEAQLCCNVGNLPSFRLILFPQQRHAAAPLHDSSRFTLCRGEKKDGERERPTCEKGASKKNPPWKVKCVDPSSHPKINRKSTEASAAGFLVIEKSPKEAENTKVTATAAPPSAFGYSIGKGKVSPKLRHPCFFLLTPQPPVEI